jgi:hypothetical protein
MHVFTYFVPSQMSSTLTSILASARRVGQAQAAFDRIQYPNDPIDDEAVTQRCMRTVLLELVALRIQAHSPSPEHVDQLVTILLTQALSLNSWTLGAECTWFSGEREGHFYTVFFKPTNGAKLGLLRITLTNLAHQCQECT